MEVNRPGNPSQRGIIAAERIASFRHSLDINIEQAYLILNGLRGDTIPQPLQEQIDALDIPLLGSIPFDETLLEFEFSGRSLLELDANSSVYKATVDLIRKIL